MAVCTEKTWHVAFQSCQPSAKAFLVSFNLQEKSSKNKPFLVIAVQGSHNLSDYKPIM